MSDVSGEQIVEDVRTVGKEAIRKIDRDADDSVRSAVASAIGDTIPDERGGEDYKANLLVRAVPIVEDAIELRDNSAKQ